MIGVNLSHEDLYKNRSPDLAVNADPCAFLIEVCEQLGDQSTRISAWKQQLKVIEDQATAQIEKEVAASWKIENGVCENFQILFYNNSIHCAPILQKVNPLVCNSVLEEVADEDAFFVADGGDFVGAASYVLKPRNPLTWLDPGFLLFFQKKKKKL